MNTELANVVKGNDEFAFELCSQLSGGESGNLFFSPYSISAAMAMTHAGAEGRTEAAAATGITFGVNSAAPQEPKVFRADHPFIFLIQDNHTKSILFMGRLVNPNA